MKNEKQGRQADLERREFLRGSAAAGAGVAAMAVLPKQALAAAPEPEEEKQKGYRLTDHILAYYRSAAS